MTHSFPTRRSSDRIVGILATREVFILAARGKAVEARDARLQSVGIDAELRGECLQRRRCRQQLTTNLPRLQPVQVHAARQQRSERIFTRDRKSTRLNSSH